jgi:nitrogen regulatory protein PII-like uncharacterized protein
MFGVLVYIDIYITGFHFIDSNELLLMLCKEVALMNIRERLEIFWAGEKPDKIPYTIYQNEWRHTSSDPAWIPLFEDGLGVTYHIGTVKEENKVLNIKTNSYNINGHEYTKRTLVTPVGEIYTLSEDGWTQKYLLETPEDYGVMTYIAKNSSLSPNYDKFINFEKEAADYFVPLVAAGRTPFQTILVDYVGLENFAFHLYDFEDEIMELYEALNNNFKKRVEIITDGPGRFVSVLENFTAETMGPERYKKFDVSIYEKYFPMIQNSGKIIGAHYDGKLKSCIEEIAKTPIDLIESLTPPPEGDMTLGECRKMLPDKLFWSNINTGNYYLPKDKLKELVYNLVEQASPDGKKLAFEVSEQYPDNWKESIPVILEALDEIG